MGKAKEKNTIAAMRKEVKTKVRKEYESFLGAYRKMPEDIRFKKMIEDSGRIGFYRNVYIIIVIIGDITPEEWKWLYLYYKGIDIIKDFYRSYHAFQKDSEEENRKELGSDLSFLASTGFQNRNLGAWA